MVIVPAPSNYDDAGLVIRVDPNRMFQLATADMKNHGEAIANALSDIAQTWEGLAGGWAAPSATEAQDFVNRWNVAVRAMFGDGQDPSTGILPKIAQKVAVASINYGEAEDVNTKMFQSVGSGGSGGPTPPTRSDNNGPITENAPAPA
jgi:hypothetical protein